MMATPSKPTSTINSILPGGMLAPHVPLALFETNRNQLFARMLAKVPNVGVGEAVVLQGATTVAREETDAELLFRQCSHFFYVFGLNEPDCYGALDLGKKESLLFIPRLGKDYEVWCGKVKPPAFYAAKYGVTCVHYVDEMATVLGQRGIKVLHVMHGVNSDSRVATKPVKFAGMDKFTVNTNVLYWELVECRVVKSPLEIELMRHINQVSARAHVALMREARAGMGEHEIEAFFAYHTYRFGGCRLQAYTPICASGPHCAVMHYGHAGAPNDKVVADGDMLLLDMGAEYFCYASDLTLSYPANGKFTADQRVIYETVLDMNRSVIAAMAPGVRWSAMHRLAEHVLLKHMIAHDFVRPQGVSVEELASKYHLAALFFPHGLGHFMGLDVHDVGGYPPHEEKRPDAPGMCRLRTNRVLLPGMVITVEPGLYFVEALLQPALSNPEIARFLNADKIRQFMSFGGVRIEDDVVVTSSGVDDLTHVPRTVAEIESVMAGAQWQV